MHGLQKYIHVDTMGELDIKTDRKSTSTRSYCKKVKGMVWDDMMI